MYSIKHYAELLNYPHVREVPPVGTFTDIWDGSSITGADITKDDIVFLTNYDPFNPFGLTTKYSMACFTSKITNVPLGIRHLPFWHLPSVFINGPRKTNNIRPYVLPLIAEARLLKKGIFFLFLFLVHS